MENAPDTGRLAAAINLLTDFLARRDIPSLEAPGEPADWLVLFGGSPPCAYDEVARAMLAGRARQLALVGGVGHTTAALRRALQRADEAPEARMIQDYLQARHGLAPDLVEDRSSNCGENIRFLLDAWEKLGLRPASAIFVMDAAMQYRMERTLRLYPEYDGLRILHYAAYRVTASAVAGQLALSPTLWGVPGPEAYVRLLLGEISRLSDSASGYGPKGRNFLAHTDIPEEVAAAAALLAPHFQTRP